MGDKLEVIHKFSEDENIRECCSSYCFLFGYPEFKFNNQIVTLFTVFALAKFVQFW